MTSRKSRPTAAERLAAVTALLALVAAGVLVLAGAVRNWAGISVCLVAIFVAVTSGWSAVSRRGVARLIAGAFIVGSVILFGWGLTVFEIRPLQVSVAAVLAAASIGCARIALRRSAGPQPVRVTRPRHPVLIMNPKSGGGKAARYHLVEECEARGIEPVVLKPGDDLTKLAEDAVARGADVIGMAGGDGSQALVATVAARHRIPHVVVPAGTRNHFALDLGLDREDLVASLDAFADGIERLVDLADVNGRVFVNNASLGLYAKIVQSPEYRNAKLKTAADLLPRLLGPDAEPLDLRFTAPGAPEYPSAHLILVSNDPYQLDHVGGRGTRARLDLGTLGVVAARINGAAAARRFMMLEAAGRIRRFEGWLEWETRRFEVRSGGPVEIALDGESLAMEPPLTFASRPGALRVRIPRHAPSLSPAAKALHLASRATTAELIAIALNRHPATTPPVAGDAPEQSPSDPRTAGQS